MAIEDWNTRVKLSLAALILMLALPSLAAAAPCPPDALGTSRVLEVGAPGGLQIGFKTYPQTLQLEDHEVVLTFDDGPNPGTTDHILDALAKQCVKATFFIIGREAMAYPALLKREYEAGETIGHHSYSHPAKTLRLMTEEAAKADIDKGFAADDRILYGSAGPEPRVPFFRFPGFADTPALVTWLSSRNIAVFGADFWAFDWLDMSSEEELQIVLRKLEREKRGILLLHDSRASTAAMLPDLLDELKKRGFKIVHLVPGAALPPLQKAPEGWSSETEAVIARTLAGASPPASSKKPEHLQP
ncbi:polysaccharide deacetylase family protein [Methyloferula stellata]|uniref:polysaccharide deacetylase family protein n=1 Tax=Methyloferula stellata TaxID=876270 RepID=UPI0003709162|nr:polysaccharide deacetylase family protein [Methyloferula stellata]